jgi:peptidoglycan/LPS O-acetylase OafA/YrhL
MNPGTDGLASKDHASTRAAPATSHSGIAYRPEIDGLRAIAVLQVVLYHAGVGPGAGYVGVDVFFVISGYLITLLLLREWAACGRIDLAAFYARRVRRIFPAALLVVVTTLFAGAVLLSPDQFAHMARSAAASALFVANLFFQFASGGYFDTRSDEMPLLHLWSLAVEEQFYLAWPALLIVLLKWRSRLLLPLLGVLAVASLALAEALILPRPEAAFYQMPARFWELAVGGLIAFVPVRERNGAWMAASGLVLVLAAGAVPVAYFPGFGALAPVLGAGLVIAAVHGGGALGVAGSLLRSAPMLTVGLLSYSFYLWHWPLLALFRATTVGEGELWIRLLLCLIALVLAAASYRYVEQPLRRAQHARWRVLLCGGAVSALVAATAFVWSLHAQRQALGTDDPLARAAYADRPPDSGRCHYQRGSSDFPRPNCESRPRVAPTIAIWGDSMALAWKPLAWRLAREGSTSAIAWSRDSCPPLFDFRAENGRPPDAQCAEFVRYVADQTQGLRTLFLVMSLGKAGLGDRVAALERTLSAVSPNVGRVIVLGPTPHLRDTVPKCIRSGQLQQCAVRRAEFDMIAAPQVAALRALAARYPNVEVIDMTSFFCTATECPAVKDGMPLYWDEHHVSTSAVEAFAEGYLAGRENAAETGR